MKKNDSVFQLIKSLTRGEKRNFRMLAQLTSGDKKYLQLFDVMDGIDEYDEAKILKKFRKDASFEKQFAYNKNYLYNSILNALAYFHKGMDAELSSLTIQVKILLEKNLYFQAKKLLRKAKEKVTVMEKFEEMLNLLQFETEILKRTENIKLLREAVRQVEFEEKVTLEKISNMLEYRRLDTRTFILMKTLYTARNESEMILVREIQNSEFLEDEGQALTSRAKILYNEIRRRVCLYEGNEEGALRFSERAVELYESNPIIKEDEKIAYLQQVSSQARSTLKLYGLQKTIPTIMRLRDVKISTPQERVFRFKRFYFFLIGMYVDTGETAPEGIIDELLAEMKTLKNDLATSFKLWAYWCLALYYLEQGQLKKALQWMNDFLNHPRSAVRTDLQASSRLLNLVIHFELGNYDLIEYNIKSASRFMYKQERLHKYERRFLSFLRKAINISNQEELTQEFENFREDLVEIFQDDFERKALDYFNVLAWVDSKILGKSFALTLREQNEHRILGEEIHKQK